MKKVLIIIGVLVVLGIIGAVALSDTETTSDNASDSTETNDSSSSEPTTAKLGEAARDGKFEFVVKSVDCGKISVGTNEFLTAKAQGQFCLLNITVKNIGDEPQSLFSDNQYLFNDAGQKYSADGTATIYASPDETDVWLSEINPGNSIEGVIVFDIPKDQTPTSAELHDSALSNGIKVNLK